MVTSIDARAPAPRRALAAPDVTSISARALTPCQASAALAIRVHEVGTKWAPTVPTKGGHGVEAKTVDKYYNRGCTGEFSMIFFSNTFSSQYNVVDMVCHMNIHHERF